jgi:hypothetical protein
MDSVKSAAVKAGGALRPYQTNLGGNLAFYKDMRPELSHCLSIARIFAQSDQISKLFRARGPKKP